MERATQDGQQSLVTNQAVVRRERRVEDLTDTLANISGSVGKIADLGQGLTDKMIDNIAEKDVNAVALGIQKLNDKAELDESITKADLVARTNELYAENQRDISGFRYDDRFTKLVEPAMAKQFQIWDKRQKKIDRKVSLEKDTKDAEAMGRNADKKFTTDLFNSRVKLGGETTWEASLFLTKQAVTSQDTDFSKDGEFYQDLYNEEGRDALFDYMYGDTLGMEHMEEGGYNYNLLQSSFDKYEKAIMKANGGGEVNFAVVDMKNQISNVVKQARTGKMSVPDMEAQAEDLQKKIHDPSIWGAATDSEKKYFFTQQKMLTNGIIATNKLNEILANKDLSDTEAFAAFNANNFYDKDKNKIDVGKDFAKNVASRLQESVDETLNNPEAKPEDIAKSMAMSYKINNRTGVKSKVVLRAEKIASGDIQATTLKDITMAIAASNQGKEGTSNADKTTTRTMKELEAQLTQWKLDGTEPKLPVLNSIIRANKMATNNYMNGVGRTKMYNDSTDSFLSKWFNTTYTPATMQFVAAGIASDPSYPDTEEGMVQFQEDNMRTLYSGSLGAFGATAAAFNPLYAKDTMQTILKHTDGTVLSQSEQQDGMSAMFDVINRDNPNAPVQMGMSTIQVDSTYLTDDKGVKQPAWRIYLKQDGKLLPYNTIVGTDLKKYMAQNENWKANNKMANIGEKAKAVSDTTFWGTAINYLSKLSELGGDAGMDTRKYFFGKGK